MELLNESIKTHDSETHKLRGIITLSRKVRKGDPIHHHLSLISHDKIAELEVSRILCT